MKNVNFSTKGNIVTIEVDLSKSFGRSKTGKSEIIASTEGNVSPNSDGIYFGVNVYKK